MRISSKQNPFTAANQPGTPTATGPTENLVLNTIKHVRRTRWDGKIDHQFTPVAPHLRPLFAGPPSRLEGRLPGAVRMARDRSQRAARARSISINGVFSDMLILSPTSNNEFRVGYNRRVRRETAFTRNEDWAQQLGIPNVSAATFPIFNIGYGLTGLTQLSEHRRGFHRCRTTSPRSAASTP